MKISDFTNGILRENPILVLAIGLCPTLAVSTSVANSLAMGIASAFVLVCSNLIISMFRNYIPNQIRIPIFIIIISTFVTIVDYIMAAYTPLLHKSLGVFIPLIVVNCIILGRAEAFACKMPVLASILDGLGMGLGFILIITIIGFVREILGNGTLPYIGKLIKEPALMMILPPGGFIALGILHTVLNWWRIKKGEIV